MSRPNLLGLDREAMHALCASLGQKPFRANQLMQWVHHRQVDDWGRMTDLARDFRERLATEVAIEALPVLTDQKATDGTRKWLLGVGGADAIEMVYIPERARGTLCISSQAGCAVNCRFCSTGHQGFSRNLSTAEIMAQPWLANRLLAAPDAIRRTTQLRAADGRAGGARYGDPGLLHTDASLVDSDEGDDDALDGNLDGNARGGNALDGNARDGNPTGNTQSAVTNVVFMGMGEPLLNYDAVLPAIRILLDDRGYGLSRRRVTVSTSGVVPMMDRLGQDCPVALAVSLHAPNDALRDELVPLNRKYPLDELMQACRRYLEVAPRDFITFEYVMLDGINDRPEHARELLERVRDVPCKLNLIPFNPFPASGLRRSTDASLQRFSQMLQDGGIVTTVRRTRGDDIDAACGQLAGEVADRTRRRERAARVLPIVPRP